MARKFVSFEDCGQMRRVMVVIRGKVRGYVAWWTNSCSGCTETVDGQNTLGHSYDPKAGCLVGGGCDECGYTGKRRMGMWFELPKDVQRKLFTGMAGEKG